MFISKTKTISKIAEQARKDRSLLQYESVVVTKGDDGHGLFQVYTVERSDEGSLSFPYLGGFNHLKHAVMFAKNFDIEFKIQGSEGIDILQFMVSTRIEKIESDFQDRTHEQGYIDMIKAEKETLESWEKSLIELAGNKEW